MNTEVVKDKREMYEIALWVGRSFLLASVCLVGQWNATDRGLTDLNNHPLFMTLGLIFFGGMAITTYRLTCIPRPISKALHFTFHTLGVVFFSFGLGVVWNRKNEDGTYKANMQSLHSYVGLATCLFYGGNFLLGTWWYLNPCDIKNKARFTPVHIVLGSLSVLGALVAMTTGVAEHQASHSASPDSDKQFAVYLISSAAVIIAFVAFSLIAYGLSHRNDEGTKEETQPLSRSSLQLFDVANEITTTEINLQAEV